MKRKWSARSKAVYDELDSDLQYVCTCILARIDVSLIEGHRGEQEQNEAFDNGYSKVRFPDGKHNSLPSLAVDLQPYPMPKDPLKLWETLGFIAGMAIEIGRRKGIRVRWGGNWREDGDLTNNSFDDLFHLEIVK